MSSDDFTLRRKPNGDWIARAEAPGGITGRRRQRSRTIDGSLTEEQARAEARAWRSGLSESRPDEPLADALMAYVGDLEARGASPNTVHTYRTYTGYVRAVAPRATVMGTRPGDVDEMETELLRRGAHGRPLGRNTVLGFHWFLRGAYWWIIARPTDVENPVLGASKPRPDRHEAEPLSDADLAALQGWVAPRLDGSDPCRGSERALAFAIFLALATGARGSELLAVRVRDVRPSVPDVHIGGTLVQAGGGTRRKDRPKSSSGYRNVTVTPEDMGQIRAFMESQGRTRPSDPLVTWDGRWMPPSSLRDGFRRVCDGLGIPREVTFHTLRHTHATIWLMCGGDLRTLQERLGHKDFATTARLYGHVVPGRDAAGARAVRAALDRSTVGPVDK